MSSFFNEINEKKKLKKRFGNPYQKKEWLAQITSMEKLASYCLTEPNSGSDSISMVNISKISG